MSTPKKNAAKTTRSRTTPRLTPQRRAVLAVLQKSIDHPNAAEVYRRVREMSPGIGFATVYRTLNYLAENQIIQGVRDGSNATRFDGNIGHHDHLICRRCQKVVDVKLPLPASLRAAATQESGFVIDDYRLEFYGLCPACRQGERSSP